MSRCIRCNSEMVSTYKDKKNKEQNLFFRTYPGNSSEKNIVISTDDGLFKNSFDKIVQCEICTNCGEVRLFIDIDK